VASLPNLHQQLDTFQRRTFLSSLPSIPGLTSSPQTLSARRTLPYTAPFLYRIISDIDAYKHFLPYCTSSRVHAFTTPQPPSADKYPALASLTVGWGPVTESYTSRVYCIPGEIVEAVSGDADTQIDKNALRRVGYDVDGKRERGEVKGLFDSLVTRWTVTPTTDKADRTDVMLDIRYKFANPAYGLAVGKVADEVACMMIEAFEKRARELYRP
jgi:coenzyme Q-binding protein COQ10